MRTLLLVGWIAIVFRIAAFWGIFLSTIVAEFAASPAHFFIFISLALLVSAIVFAYLHHLFFKNSPPNWPRWLPGPFSLGEGFYAPVVMVISTFTVLITVIPFLPILECGLQTSSYAQSYCFQQYMNQYQLDKVAIGVWIFISVYLYQFEYLIRQHFTRKKQQKSNVKLEPKKKLNKTEIELSKLRGEMGLTQAQKGVLNSTPTRQTSQSISENPKKRRKQLIVILLFLVSIVASLTWAKWSEIQQLFPVSITSQNPVIVTPVTPSQPKVDPFQAAVNQAMSAAKLTQIAKTQGEWNQVVSLWGEAIAHLKLVPQTHPNYAKAQEKIAEYQRNLEYAKLAANRAQ